MVNTTKKVTVFSKVQNYFKQNFTSDLKAGFITSVVALPLAIAFAIASGLDPIIGIYTAIIGGFLASTIAGSKFSITGPTGAMAVIILMVVQKHGIEGLLLAGFLAGLIQLLLGIMRFGKAIAYIPLPVISGFTAGIGAIIFLGQLPNALGITIASHEFIGDTLKDIIANLAHVNIDAILITLATIILLLILPLIFRKSKLLKNIPVSIFPLVLSVLAVFYLALNVPIIGVIPKGLPHIDLLKFNWDLVKSILPSAFTIAMLGSIEALLCAVVADGMSSTKHNPNKELIAQGATNMIVPFFGGMPVTAAIARTAVNIREGAKTRVSGVIHAIFILLYMIVLNPVIALVPKAFLAGILLVISAKMINLHEFKIISKISKADTLVLLTTFVLTILTDLVFAVQVGMVLAIILLFYRLSKETSITNQDDYKDNSWINNHTKQEKKIKENVSVYTIYGPFFFGAMSIFEKKITEHNDFKKLYLIIRMKNVPFIDSTALVRLKDIVSGRIKSGKEVYLVGLLPSVKKQILEDEEFMSLIGKNHILEGTKEALGEIKKKL